MRTVIVTGGTKGLGLKIVEKFTSLGDEVFYTGREGTGVNFLSGDARYYETHVRWIEAAIKKTGKIDVYINNVGLSGWKSIKNADLDWINRMIDTNLKSTLFGSKAAATYMQQGVILNVSSLAGKRGSANNSVYCATKFAVTGLTQALAKECGPNIRVNAVCPVYLDTPGLMQVLGEPEAPGFPVIHDYLEQFTKTQSCLNRLPKGEEVADLLYYLSNAHAITGQNIHIDCGVFPN